jgi:hypothetical protein
VDEDDDGARDAVGERRGAGRRRPQSLDRAGPRRRAGRAALALEHDRRQRRAVTAQARRDRERVAPVLVAARRHALARIVGAVAVLVEERADVLPSAAICGSHAPRPVDRLAIVSVNVTPLSWLAITTTWRSGRASDTCAHATYTWSPETAITGWLSDVLPALWSVRKTSTCEPLVLIRR